MPDLPRIRDKYYKQFDKYFIFVEQAIRKTKDAGYICYIVPNKFFKVGAGEHLRSLIAKGRYLVSLDDFGDAQLFEDTGSARRQSISSPCVYGLPLPARWIPGWRFFLFWKTGKVKGLDYYIASTGAGQMIPRRCIDIAAV
ncbi:Eco57I restriction-modification methylase domain-containing protein [Ruthenibacterium lactatiformans]|uniref:Eco57I restriction-modification methylase domain-containing protein n=1 Tax=Ruthenibacterium lactatiformans TaxID=1550024 RepID=UPI0019687C31|nr:Eco57I restriction-modification methylase domain-containing protein [Ruthenibacterium lactatiformans]MBN3012467.1 Eco57I restriction-modification methylase domain-containing protein [Ruthenibacterium lactatiformans]